MAKRSAQTQKYDSQHIANIGRYQRAINTLYDKVCAEAAKLVVKTGFEDGDGAGTFDIGKYSKPIRNSYANLMNRLKNGIQTTIESGVRAEWELSDKKNEELIDGEVDEAADEVDAEKAARAKALQALKFQRNEQAVQGFLQRSVNGLSLSDRVWNITSQFEQQMQMAISVSLTKGRSAQQLSQDIRGMLKEPDMMYRRYYTTKVLADGTKKKMPEWRRKVVDAAGNVHFVKQPLEHTGRGVYRSAYKNAMRVARTETNMAYHAADTTAWGGSQVIVGIEVHLSNNHTTMRNGKRVPLVDICDTFNGCKFPKWFEFTGWHPQCRCIAVPITPPTNELIDYLKKVANGEDVSNYHFSNEVTQLPPEFTGWMKDNATRLQFMQAHDRLPYFVKRNFVADADFTNGARKEDLLINQKQEPTADELKESRIQAAKEARIAKRTPESIQAIKDERNRRTQLYADIVDEANDVLKKAKKAPWLTDAQITEIDIAKTKYNNLYELKKRVAAIDNEIQENETAIRKFETLIPNVRNKWAKKFSKSEIETAYKSVNDRFNRWTWDFTTQNSLDWLKARLEKEVTIVTTTGKKYKTWEVAKEAFDKRLNLVKHRIDMKSVKDSILQDINILSKDKGKVSKRFISEFDNLFKDDKTDINLLKKQAAKITAKSAQIQAKNKAKKAASISLNGMTDDDIRNELMNIFGPLSGVNRSDIVIKGGYVDLPINQHQYLYNVQKISSKDEKQSLSHIGGGYIGTSNSFKINGCLRDIKGSGKYAVVGDLSKHDLTKCADKYGDKLTSDDIITIKTLDKIISDNPSKVPIRCCRFVDEDAVKNMTGKKDFNSFATSLANGDVITGEDLGFMSFSTNSVDNVFKTRRDYMLEIETPAGTPMYITKNVTESEGIFARGTKLQFLSVRTEYNGYNNGHKLNIIRCKLIN